MSAEIPDARLGIADAYIEAWEVHGLRVTQQELWALASGMFDRAGESLERRTRFLRVGARAVGDVFCPVPHSLEERTLYSTGGVLQRRANELGRQLSVLEGRVSEGTAV